MGVGVSSPWLHPLRGKDMTCTDHLLFCPVPLQILVRVILSQQNLYLLTACCVNTSKHFIHSPRVIATICSSLFLGEGSLTIALLQMREPRLSLGDLPQGHRAKGELLAWLVDTRRGRKEASQVEGQRSTKAVTLELPSAGR